jgi:FixJ family two-component response regulator
MTVENAIVFVVDDDPSVRKSLDRLLRSVGLAVETFATAHEFLEQQCLKGPSCLVLDVKMPGISGLELQEKLLSQEHVIPIVFITSHGDIPMTVKAIKKGAVNFLSKPFDEKDLLDAVYEALQRDSKTRAVRQELEEIQHRLESLITGRLNKQIANSLDISEKTVKVHRGRVMQKMGVDSVAELVRLAEKLDIKPA